MIRINFRKNTQAKVVRHRQRVPMTRGTWLLSAAVFFIMVLFLFFLIRSFLAGNRQDEIGQRPHQDSFSCQVRPPQPPATMSMN